MFDMKNDFFPLRADTNPTIYAYEDSNPQFTGLLKVGFTTINAQTRLKKNIL